MKLLPAVAIFLAALSSQNCSSATIENPVTEGMYYMNSKDWKSATMNVYRLFRYKKGQVEISAVKQGFIQVRKSSLWIY